MFSTIFEFVLCSFCSKLDFNTLLLLSLTSKDIKDEIDKMRIPVKICLSKVIKEMVFNIPQAIITRFKITSLDFAMSDISEEYFIKLLQLIPLCDALTDLDLKNNRIGSEGAKKLATVLLANRVTLESPKETELGQCKLLTKLDLKNNNIGPKGIESLTAVLGVCNALIFLDLSENELGDTGIKYFALVGELGQYGSLTILKLGENQISYIGIESLVPFLKKCDSLSHLDLSYNNIGPLGAGKLASLLVSPHCRALSLLDLSTNLIGPVGAKKLAEVLICPQCNLTHLFLECNCLGKIGVKSLERAKLQCRSLTFLFI
jgi:Ran GTPase-activating protein (RanGAP) involved in mRNA processing and transport